MTMVATVKRIIANENGFVLGASILISAILLLAGVFALWTANTGMHIVRNEGDLTVEFYNAEGGVIDALENYDAGTMAWLTDAFLTTPPRDATVNLVSSDSYGYSAAQVNVRCINNDCDPTEAAANHLPWQRHVSAPPEGSGFSLKYFEVRRYGITATSATGNTQVQVGAYKVFNKY